MVHETIILGVRMKRISVHMATDMYSCPKFLWASCLKNY